MYFCCCPSPQYPLPCECAFKRHFRVDHMKFKNTWVESLKHHILFLEPAFVLPYSIPKEDTPYKDVRQGTGIHFLLEKAEQLRWIRDGVKWESQLSGTNVQLSLQSQPKDTVALRSNPRCWWCRAAPGELWHSAPVTFTLTIVSFPVSSAHGYIFSFSSRTPACFQHQLCLWSFFSYHPESINLEIRELDQIH